MEILKIQIRVPLKFYVALPRKSQLMKLPCICQTCDCIVTIEFHKQRKQVEAFQIL